MAPQQIEQLAAVVQRFVANKGEADIHKWANAVDMTATRMGFLICNDLEVATRIVQTEPVSIGVADPKEKIRDLVLWSVSDEYFALREHLGLVIGQGNLGGRPVSVPAADLLLRHRYAAGGVRRGCAPSSSGGGAPIARSPTTRPNAPRHAAATW